ncbi:Nose resistant to fluoxetine protein [Schistosoma japonicum]|uniref:Nose resistant to fluoxetine protein n=1 Tax=Schistosoma japonicum TaxID=6182 RepID=A0A4Z2DH11_SCHJA|nr:Nose resistant to fluoxetine protein [Schistosoma japonicum]
MRWLLNYIFILALCLPVNAHNNHLPIYSYDNSILLLLHPFDPKILNAFAELMNYTRVSMNGWLTFLDRKKLQNNPFLNNSACVVDMTSILYGISRSNEEAMKWLDAAGKIVPGISGGAINWVGSMELCRNITDFSFGVSRHVKGKYCTAFVELPTSDDLPQQLSFELNYGVCIPHSCTKDDLIWLLDMVFSRVNLSVDDSTSFCHAEFGELQKDGWFWVAMSLLVMVTFLLISGTLVDVVIWCLWSYHTYVNSYNGLTNSSMSVETVNVNEALVDYVGITEDENMAEQTHFNQSNANEVHYSEYRSNKLSNTNLFVKFISNYSVPFNTFCLWNSKPSQVVNKLGQHCDHPLLCLDGIRFITMCWIIYGHCIAFSMFGANNMLLYSQIHQGTWTYQVIIGATLAVDTFFFMSGTLSTYLTIPRLRRITNWKSWIKFWFNFVFHRTLRLTPAYLLVLILYTGLFIHAYVGPLYPQIPNLTDIKFCRDHWWITYLNNFIYPNEICMGWSWYLSNEFQFSIVLAPIFLSLLAWNETIGVLFGFGLVISSIVVTFGISYANDYLPGVLELTSFTTVYIKPYTRWSTYAIGLLCGWLLEKYTNILQDVGIKMKVMLALIGICLSSIFCVSTVYGLYGLLSGKVEPFSTVGAAAYTAFHRPIFVLGVAIVVSMCALGCGGPIHSILTLPVFCVPARLTYTAYLVHPIVTMFIVLGSQNPLLLDNLHLIVRFFAVMPITYFVGLIISLATESPVIAMTHVSGRKKPSLVKS